MTIDISKYGNIYEKLMYKDKCSVSRVTVVKDGPFDNNTSRQEVPGLQDINCKVSFSRPDAPLTSNGVYNVSDRVVTIFMPTRYDILEGDWITATITHSNGRVDVVKGITNLPDIFQTHQQVLIREIEDA